MESHRPVQDMDVGQQSARRYQPQLSAQNSEIYLLPDQVVRTEYGSEKVTTVNRTTKERHSYQFSDTPSSNKELRVTPRGSQSDPSDQDRSGVAECPSGQLDTETRSHFDSEPTQRCEQQETKAIARAQLSGHGHKSDGADNELSESDVETFTGKILYNPDGLYIIEGDSEMVDEECSLDLPQQTGGIVDVQGATPTQYMVFPEIINAFHIYRNSNLLSALYGQTCNRRQQKKKVPDIPTVHSYKVFNLRDNRSSFDNKEFVKTGFGGPKLRSDNEDRHKIYRYSSVPVKPILMCFMCKLSFSYAKSFVAHAVKEHAINLLDEEGYILSQVNVSAIIQGVGKDKVPLISFLKPAHSFPAQVSENDALSQSFNGSSLHLDADKHPFNFTSAVVVNSVSPPTSTAESTASSSHLNPTPSVRDIKKSFVENEKKDSVQCTATIGPTALKLEDLESLAPELEDLANIERLAKAAVAAAEATSSGSSSKLQQINLMPKSTEAQKEDGPMTTSVSSALERRTLSTEGPTSYGSSSSESSASPKTSMSPDLLTVCSHSLASSTNASYSICPQHLDNSHPDCSKCDMVSGSSSSLGSHMEMMHSRNSCKTLKCPKCNWHYKYQETLEIHMKEKHSENETSCVYCITNQRHPKLSRGETYTCGYKPYRCEICNYSTVTKGNLSIHMHSDKHLNNLKDLQSGNLSTKHVLPSQNATVANASETTKKASPLTKPKATWRCDICNYETNVARNLRIHMTSEKHTHNAMVVQQNVKHMQQLSALHYAQVMDPMFGQFHSGVLFSPDAQLQPEAALADLYYNQALIMIANQQQQQQQGSNPVGNNSTQASLYFPYASAADVERVDPTLSSDISQGDSALFFCCVCSCFSTNSIESLNQHFQVDRTEEGEDDTMIVIGGNYVCKLCAYKTHLKANFQLHCKTDKHYQGLQHINHIREGGPRNEWKLKYAKTSNAVQVRCNVCDCYTNSIHELQLHSSNPRHEISAKLFLYLQYSENGLETETTSYHCSLCNFSGNTKVRLVQHVHSLEHLRNEHLRQMQRKLEGHESVDDFREIYTVKSCRGQKKETKYSQTAQPQTVSAESKPVGSKGTNSEGQSEESKLKETLTDSLKNGGPAERDRVLTCPLCDYTNVSEVLIQMHVVVQHSQKQNLQCPLCQECLYELPNLEKHLMESHKVNRESVDRLLMIVDKTDVESDSTKFRDHQREDYDSKFKNDSGNLENSNNDDEGADDLECPFCLKLFNNVDDLFVHQNEKGHMELKQTPGGLGYICWKKGCHQFFRMSQALQMHFKEVHVKKFQLTLSDSHVYRFRCNQCRLTFKTMEKLKSHSRYHLIRATSQCVLCGRSFQSVSSLQKHVESSHTNLTKEEIKQYEASLVNNPLLSSTGNLILNPHATEALKEESNKDRAEETEKKASSDPPGQTNQSSANVSSNSEECNTQGGHLDDCTLKEQVTFEDYLNNQVMAENSYNDLNRKYKCHRCKVAFTKQSYLTSHNKTLIHKKGEKTSYPVDRYLDPNRPYKCEVCKESFTQKNILFVHFNSVSHLHKLKQSMKDSSTIFTTLTTHNLTKPVTSNTNSGRCQSPVTTSSESEKKLYKCNICKVAYNQSSTLDMHLRSVLHQTKASKLHELAIIGEVDLNLPLIEKPELSQSQEDHKNAETGTSQISHVSANITTSLAQPPISTDFDTFPQTSLPITGSSLSGNFSPKIPFSFLHGHPLVTQTDFPQTSGLPNLQVSPQTHILCKRCSLSLPTRDALFHHQRICNFTRQPASSLFSYDNVPEISGSTHASTVSSFLQSKDIVSGASLKETVTKSEKLSSQNICNRDQCDTALELPKSKEQVTSQMHLAKCPYPRSKSLIYKHLLESCGFEIVMQFNEFNQHKTRTDTEGENITSKDTAKTKSSAISDEEVQSCYEKSKNRYLPEINKSVCNVCSKEFSSIWVLKAHREEYHKEIVPFALLEHVSQEFRLYYDKKNLASNLPQQDELKSNSDTASTPISTPDYSISSQNITNGTAQPGLSFRPVTPIIPHSSQQIGDSSNFAANQMAAQFQFQQLLMSMGFGMNVPMGTGMPFTNNIHPSLIPIIFPPPVESMMASAFSHPFMGTGFDSTAFNAQQKILQEKQEQYLQTQQQKRARTRINDDQLKILKTYFNINNSPSEEQLKEMSVKSGLPLKVIKHWFRNTLFKERQRNKDSPYNFSNPPSTFLNLEEYEKTGKAKSILAQESNQECYKNNDAKDGVTAEESKRQVSKKGLEDRTSEPKLSSDTKQYFADSMPATPVSSESNDKIFDAIESVCDAVLQNTSIKITESSTEASNSSEQCDVQSEGTNFKDVLIYSEDKTTSSSLTGIATVEILDNQRQSTQGPSSSRCLGKRANRTRFTDYQVKILQEFFETNAYPKDDSLEYLSKLLNLSPRVVVVWFQNARQKARKVYENQGPTPSDEDTNGRFQRTPGLNYQCKKCLQVYQRYYELIKHQKGSCFKNENPLASRNNKASTPSYESSVNPSVLGSAQGVPVTQDKRKNNQNSTYQCGLKFSRFNQWKEHQLVHIMNPTIIPNYPNKSQILHLDKQQTLIPPVKRKLTDDKDAPKDTSEQPRDKRLRTTILPEQLDYLYQRYQLESNPSRKMLESIAREVCLRKRVVQVWFQNTRARERKGYFRAHQQVIHKRCPFCRALFKARSALETHLATKHADKYTKGDIQIDTLPDGETDTDGGNSAGEESVSAFQEMPFSNPSVMSSGLSCLSLDVVQNATNTKHEDSLLNYLDELRISPNYKTDVFGVNLKEKEQPKINLPEARERPLDLSVPSKISVKSQKLIDSIQTNLTDKSVEDYSSKFIVSEDTVSETLSESTDREEDISYSGSQTCSITQNQLSTPSITRKRARTQLTVVQVKIMKSIFIDYKTPSVTECEFLGHEIGLPKRVVQVWFQNARAKEKKSSIAFANTHGQNMDASQPSNECKICKNTYSIKYTNTSVQEHIFSKNHIKELKLHIEENKKNKELLKSSKLSRDLPAPIEAKQPKRDFVTSGHVKSTQSDSMQQIKATGPQKVSNLERSLLPTESFQSSGEIEAVTSNPESLGPSNLPSASVAANTSRTLDISSATSLVSNPSTPNKSQSADVTSFSTEGTARFLPYMFASVPANCYSGTTVSPNMRSTGRKNT